MAYPVAKVSIAFNDGPYVASPTWTDVSSYVREISTDRGRSDDWGEFSGSAQVVLDNRSRIFDPYYTSGTYYGKLLPRRQIKIEATYSGSTYAVFRGFIDGWPATWTDAGRDATVTLSCFDALQLFGSTQLPAAWSQTYIKSKSPRHYWPLDDPIPWYKSADFEVRDLGSTTSSLKVKVANAFPDSPLAAGVPYGSVGADNATALEQTSGTVTSSASSFTIAAWVKNVSGTIIDFQMANKRVTLAYVSADSAIYYRKWEIYVEEPSPGSYWTTDSTDIWDPSDTYHVAITWNNSTSTLKFYVDGVEIPKDAVGQGTSFWFTSSGYERFYIKNSTVQEIATWNSVLTHDEIKNIIKFSEGQYAETTSARIDRLIAETSFPTSRVSTPASPTGNVLDITPDNASLISEMQLVANTESAPLFVTKDGIVTMYKSDTIFTQTKSTTSQQTYGSGGLPMGTEVMIQPDGDSMRNTVNVRMSQNGVYNTADSTSVTDYGTAAIQWQTQAASITDAQISGNMIKTLGKSVYPSITPIEVVLSPNESWTSTLGLELNERITVVTAPPSGNTISLPLLVQRIRHRATPGEWQTTLEGSNRWAQSYTP